MICVTKRHTLILYVLPLFMVSVAMAAPGIPPCCEGIASPGGCVSQPGAAGAAIPGEGTELRDYFDRAGPDAALWYQHVQALASPAFEGRAPGTRGIEWAAEYIEFYFREYGLGPPFSAVQSGESYRQPLTLEGGASGCCATACAPAKKEVEWAAAKVAPKSIRTENVAGALSGKGRLKDEWIVIGGHYDHVGRGPGCGQAASNGGVLLGADDNASGTAAVLMLAQRLSRVYADAAADADLRSILFIAFTAEETGLFGSRHFVKHPHVPLAGIRAMLNLDMVGRLRQDSLWLSGLRTAAEYSDLLRPLLEQSGLSVTTDSGSHSSDQVSFLEAGIPALYAMTGGHDEVHTVSDLASTLNPAGAVKVIGLVEKIAMRLASLDRALTYVKQAAPAASCCAPKALTGGDSKAPGSGCCGQTLPRPAGGQKTAKANCCG